MFVCEFFAHFSNHRPSPNYCPSPERRIISEASWKKASYSLFASHLQIISQTTWQRYTRHDGRKATQNNHPSFIFHTKWKKKGQVCVFRLRCMNRTTTSRFPWSSNNKILRCLRSTLKSSSTLSSTNESQSCSVYTGLERVNEARMGETVLETPSGGFTVTCLF